MPRKGRHQNRAHRSPPLMKYSYMYLLVRTSTKHIVHHSSFVWHGTHIRKAAYSLRHICIWSTLSEYANGQRARQRQHRTSVYTHAYGQYSVFATTAAAAAIQQNARVGDLTKEAKAKKKIQNARENCLCELSTVYRSRKPERQRSRAAPTYRLTSQTNI